MEERNRENERRKKKVIGTDIVPGREKKSEEKYFHGFLCSHKNIYNNNNQ